MRNNLEVSLKLMFGDEGGYSNRATDRGGPTKYGITAKTLASHRGVGSVTANQVKNLKIEEARDIYIGSYWAPSGGDVLPDGLDYAAFDFGVNSGPLTAVKKLQEVLGITVDGWIGPQTRSAVAQYAGGIQQLIEDYCARRMAFLRSLKGKQGFSSNGRGWTIRVTGIDPKGEYPPAAGVIGNALALAKATKAKPMVLKPKPDPLPANGDSKAMPAGPNPWTKPEVLGPVGGVLGGLPAILSVQGPLQYVIAAGVALLFIVGIVYAFRRILRTQP
jgi:lysozyme family protein